MVFANWGIQHLNRAILGRGCAPFARICLSAVISDKTLIAKLVASLDEGWVKGFRYFCAALKAMLLTPLCNSNIYQRAINLSKDI